MRVHWGLRRWSHKNWKLGSQSLIQRSAKLYTSTSREDVEEYVVTCGSSGMITVDLRNPTALLSPTAPLILYLPPHPSHITTTQPSIPPFLFRTSYAIARINYRWNHISPLSQSPNSSPSPHPLSTHPTYRNHPFPTPLHDTLHAFTYLTTHLLPRFAQLSSESNASPSTPPPSPYAPSMRPKPPPQRPLIIYGSKLGGTLATTLALTESHASRQHPFPITSLIVRDGIYDWTGVATTFPPTHITPSTKSLSNISDDARFQHDGPLWSVQTLHALKRSLFSHPASAFDPFASPILFFRTAGLSIPSTWLSPSPEPSASTSDSPSSQPPSPSNSEEILVTRKSNLKFPPHNSGLRIPRSLFLTSPRTPASEDDDVLKQQAQEMVKLMRRSVVLHEFKERVLWDEDVDAHQVSEERVRFYELGEDGEDGEEGKVVGEWLEDV